MALYGGQRDISLFRHLNNELVNRIVSTEVGLFKISLEEMRANLYGEGENKIYYNPVKVCCLINRSNQDYAADEKGQDYNIITTFAFIRDSLVDLNLVVEVGDLVQWDNEYYEIDSIIENQYTVGKNPDTWYDGAAHGWSVSIVASGHVTRISRINIKDARTGITKSNDLPLYS